MNIKDEIKAFFRDEMFVDDVGDDESLLGSGTMDSTGMFELVSFIENTFGITVESAEVTPSNIDTVNNIEQFITKKRGGNE